MVRVITFGAFDPLHEGHLWLLQHAKAEGNHLIVVVTRDARIRAAKSREPYQGEAQRLHRVAALPVVDEAVLGDEEESYALLQSIPFDVLVVGYDQKPNDQEIRALLSRAGKKAVRLLRLPAHRPDVYKSTLIRNSSASV